MTALVVRLKALVEYLVDMQIERLARKNDKVVNQQGYLLDVQADTFDDIDKECEESIARATLHAHDLRQALAQETAQQVQALEAKRVELWRLRRELGGV